VIEQSVKAINTAVLCGASFIVQHVFLMADSSDLKQEGLSKNTVPDLEEVVRYATVKKVKVAIENVPSSSFRMFGKSIQEMVALLRLLPSETVGLCLDVNHCFACGLDPMEVLTTIEVSRLISIHASDNLSSPLADRHLPIGAGDIPWERMLKDLRALAFQGSFIIEVLDEKALIDSINYLRSLNVQDLAISIPASNPNWDLNSIKGCERRRQT
jgi:sugar phosphate isomerase/epimerase